MPRLVCSILGGLLITGTGVFAEEVTIRGDALHISIGHENSHVTAEEIYKSVTPSLVAVQYVWADELNKRELISAGLVVGDDLVMMSLAIVPPNIPDDQMKDFKIIVPNPEGDPEEVDAVFQGRDERTGTAFVKPKKPQHWKAIEFRDIRAKVGDDVLSVGMLPQGGAYKPYLMESKVAADVRGEVPQVLVQGGGLAAMFSPVLNEQGKAIGVVSFQQGQSVLLNRDAGEMAAITSPPKLYVPTHEFMLSIKEPPTPEAPIKLPWTGMSQLTGLSKDVAEALDLKNKPAIQIGEVLPGTAGEQAGLKAGDIILKLNGEPLERGDQAQELPDIFRHHLIRHKVGEEVTFTVLRGTDPKPLDIKVTLAEQPKQANRAKRFFAEDLGFVVRELVFNDTYMLKLPVDQPGVIVALERPQSAAQSAGLHNGDVITQLNHEPIKDLDGFQTLYASIRKDKPHEPLVLVVQRRNAEETIKIEPPQ